MIPRLIGGEMVVWSDLDGKHGAGPARAATLRPLLGAAFGRTLVAGPHSPSLLAALAALPAALASPPAALASPPAAALTLLVRGLPDAERLAEEFPAATVLCGSLDKLAAAPAFDTVIALDGLGRLRSAEDEAAGVTWADDLARLVSVLAPGGRLLLGLENLLGLHRMLALPAPASDSDWGDSADEYDDTRPASPALLGSALGALGLEVRSSYAAFPAPADPSLLLSSSLLADRSVRGWATAAIRTAFESPQPVAPASEPAAPASEPAAPASEPAAPASEPAAPAPASGSAAPASASGSAAPASASGSAAPASASASGSAAPASASASGSAAPASASRPEGLASGVLADPGRVAAGALRAGIGAELASAWFVLAQGSSEAPVPSLPAAIVGETPVTGELPAGPTLDELLLAASLRRDLPALRELLTAWQTGDSAGVPADRIVVGPDGTRTPLVPPLEPSVAALARLAATMIGDGHAYLWPAPADQAELTALLAALAGRETAEIPALPPTPAAPGLRELLIDRERLTRELGEARAKQAWYEKMLLGREAELKRIRRINSMLMATMPGKAAKASYGGLRAAKRALRKLKG